MFDQDRLRSYAQRGLPLLLILWLAAFIPTARKLIGFEWAQGSMALAPAKLPVKDAASLLTSDSHATPGTQAASEDPHAGLLLVAIHPLCSCTRATLRELEDSSITWKQPYRAKLLIYKVKPGASANATSSDFDWHHTGYIRDAAQALHADVIDDIGGQHAAKFGAFTSGEVLYYSAADAHGSRKLLFSGGVTAGRGMEGENGGIDALEQAVQSTAAPQNIAASHPPVYGCGLAALSKSTSGGPVN